MKFSANPTNDLHLRFGTKPISEWRAAMLRAAETADPSFPKFSHIARLGSLNLRTGIEEAFRLYEIARPHMDANVGDGKRYLDFGCGVGRIMKTFLRDFSPENMCGIDPSDELIEICKNDFGPRFNFCKIDTRPPTQLAANSIDVITSYSVFSHFSAIQATRWLDEFNRITRPGAILVLTTYGRGHLDYVCNSPSEDVSPNKLRQLESIDEAGGYDEFLRMFELGEMMFFEQSRTFGRYDYGNAYVGAEFVRRIWARHFEVVELVDDFKRLEQMVVVLRKRS